MSKAIERRIEKLEAATGEVIADLVGKPLNSLSDDQLFRIIEAGSGMQPGALAAMPQDERRPVIEAMARQ